MDPAIALQEKGYCVLKAHFPRELIHACRDALEPVLAAYLKAHRHEPNRGPHRHFLPMPFDPPCFAPEFFFDEGVLRIVRGAMDDRVVADQWGCDVPVSGSCYQTPHVDYRRPLFPEFPDLELPLYMLVVSFGLVPITTENGAMEIGSVCVPLEIGDVLIRNPRVLHRGTPNMTATPRPLVSIRYVRRWYADDSREVNPIPKAVWSSLTPEQRSVMRFTLRS